MYTIFKSFNIAYGHSVWKQTLNEKLAENCKLACRHQHGHNADVTIFVEANQLDEKGMVLDFKELGFAKKFLDDAVDHKMIIDIEDPMLPLFYPLLKDFSSNQLNQRVLFFDYHTRGNYFTIKEDLYNHLSDREKEVYNGIIIVKFIPTAENLARWIYDFCQTELKNFGTVKKVQLWETPKACAEYSI